MPATLFTNAPALLKQILDVTVSVEGTYGRGIHAIEGLKAVPRRPGIAGQTAEPFQFTAREKDFVFKSSELVLDGENIEPAKGDWWRTTSEDGQIVYYDILPDAEGRCHVECDHSDKGILWRVHMKLNRYETPPA
jgi:hypothetical protein